MTEDALRQTFPRKPFEQRLLPFLRQMELDEQARELAEIARDPGGNRKTLIMADDPKGRSRPTSYRYVMAGKDGQRRTIRFCWSCWRNAAGYFLGWRETIGKGSLKRDMWTAKKVRKRLQELAGKRAGAFKAKRTKR